MTLVKRILLLWQVDVLTVRETRYKYTASNYDLWLPGFATP